LSAINEDVDRGVRSLFKVKDYFVTEDGAAEYSVEYSTESGENFLRLLALLKAPDYSAQLFGEPGQATLVVLKNQPEPQPPKAARLSAPAFLFLLTLLSVLITAYIVAVIFPQVSPGANVPLAGVGFAGTLIAVFGARWFAQRFAARRGGFNGISYYLPNVPLFIAIPTMYFLPTFGSISFPGSPPANKDRLFDFYVVGSLAMVVVAIMASALGAGSSLVLSHAQYSALSSGNQTATVQTNPSLLQSGVISVAQAVGALGQVPPGGTLIFSPVEIAAWLALLLAFFNLMPAALFDGGRMARLVLGERASRVTTAACGVYLLVADIPNYWVIFLLVFLMAAFPVQGDTLDSITRLSRSRKFAFAGLVVLGLLCVPIPQTFATFSL